MATRAGSFGTLNIGAASGETARAAGGVDAASVTFGSGTGTVVFNHTGNTDGSDLVFNPFLTGLGTIRHESGTTILNADSSGFAGTTSVSGGMLLVGDANGNGVLGGTVDVGDGGTLGGSGTVGTTTVAAGGHIAPGSSAGTLTINGDLTLSSGSVLEFELGSPGASAGAPGISDRIDVTGDLALNGTLNLSQSDDPADGAAGLGYYRLMTYGGALSGAGLTIAATPVLADPAAYEVQTGGGNVDLFVQTLGDDTLQHWQGGDGTWNASNEIWLNQGSPVLVSWAGNHAVFKNQPGGFNGGTIAVEGAQSFKGLQFVDSGYRLEGSGMLRTDSAGSEIRVLAGETANVATTITGTGGISKTQGGTLTLTGANTYSGGTELLGGVLSISSDANLGATSGGLTFGGGTLATTADMQIARDVSLAVTGVFDVAAGTELGLAGVISGSDLRKDGSGTLRLTGTNSYGNTLVWDGTLIGDTRSISGSVGNNATVVFDQAFDGTFAGSTGPFTAPGGVMIKRGAGTLTLAGPSALDWTIEAGGLVTAAERFDGGAEIFAGASLAFEQVADAAYDGALSGTGSFLKAGAGTLLYDGDGSGFTGNTTIIDGGLIVGSGAANAGAVLGGSFDVQDGGTLGGHGTVGSGVGSMVTIASGGTIAPGNSIGTLTVDGDITFDAGSTYLAEISPALDSDLIDASGAATIGGGTVHAVKAAGVYTPGSRWTIIGADGGVTGTFDDLTQNMPFVDLALVYDANHVYIDATRNAVAFCDVAGTFNQCSTGDGLETTGAGNPVYDAVAALADGESARRALDLLSGEVHASAKSALIEDSRFIRNAANDRIRAAFDNAGAPVTPVLAYGPGDTPTAVAADYAGPVFWSHAFGSWGSIDSDGNAASLDRNTGGVLVGADAIAGDWRIGLLTGYSHSSFDIDDRVSSGSSDNYHLGLYGGTEWGNLALRTGAAYSWLDIDTHRSVSIPGFTGNLSGDYNTGIFQVFGELGYDLELDAGTRFEPFANLAHVHLRTDGFGETGGEAALSASGGGNTDVTFTTLGLRGEQGIALGTIDATLRGMVGWRHAFGDVTPESIHAFSTGNVFTIAGAPIAENAAVIEAGLDLDLTPDATVSLSYAGQFSGSAQDHGFKANFNVRF